MVIPDRLSGLIRRIEAGETVTQADVNRIAALQCLDLARIGEEFAREIVDANKEMATFLESVQ